ncbi:MAG: tyrosine-protein phosphatase [Actinomycetia bacterium]|nr:tyrosine-protein phosphatase [Actinomycetes bacterium]
MTDCQFLRCGYETGAQPSDPEQTEPGEVKIVFSPTEDHDNEDFRRVCFPVLDSPAYWPHQVEILPGMLRDTLTRIAQAHPGILVHCSAGRDRTGLVCALLLAIAGVTAELIAEDYATSVRVMAQVASRSPTADPHQGRSPEQVEQWIQQVRPQVLDFVAHTDRHLTAIGLEPTVRDRLRALLLDGHEGQ